VSDRNNRLAFRDAFQSFDDKFFRFAIQSGGRFIQQKNWAVTYYDACDADALTLAT